MAEMSRGSRVLLGGQDCHPQAGGAHTGDISANMLADAGAATSSWAIPSGGQITANL